MKDKKRTPWWILICSFVLAIGVLLLFYFKSADFSGRKDFHANEGLVLPPDHSSTRSGFPFSFKTITGDTISASYLSGKVVFLNFFATWCPPCKAEVPTLARLYNKYKSDGFIVVGICVDQSDPLRKVKEFAEKYKINYPIVLATRDVVEFFGGVSTIPTSFIIDRDGRIRTRIVGYRDEKDLEQAIKKLLDERKKEELQI